MKERKGWRGHPPVKQALSLEQVEARRTQLWAVVFVVLVGIGLIVALLSVGTPDPSFRSFFVGLPAFRFGLVLVLAGFGGYVLEQERSLRRLTSMLIEERVTAEAQSQRVQWLTELDAFKSEFVSQVERDISEALHAVRESSLLIEAVDDAQVHLLRMLRRDVDRVGLVLENQIAQHDRLVLEQASRRRAETPAAFDTSLTQPPQPASSGPPRASAGRA